MYVNSNKYIDQYWRFFFIVTLKVCNFKYKYLYLSILMF